MRSPSPQKANLKQITSLLDDDEECLCLANMQQMAMTRQKSKTEYARRSTAGRKESLWSAIQEVDEPTAEECSVTNSQSTMQ